MPSHIVHASGLSPQAHIPHTATDPVEAVIARPATTIALPRILATAPVRRVPIERTVAPKVYVALNSDGRALYVGSTDRLAARLGEHESGWASPWSAPGPGAIPAHWVWFPGTGGATDAEEGLIRLLRPLLLVERTDARGQRLAPSLPQRIAMWKCGLRW